mmetsp:Transcript_88364/g.189778  ORF Transcript_88364/g.189778 Transcript_88364/m.189778 type:complete len:264 (+) Transcript_88364:552-1343(+)
MQDKSISPVSSFCSKRRPSFSLRSTPMACKSAFPFSGAMSSRASAKVQRPRRAPPSSSASRDGAAMATERSRAGTSTRSPGPAASASFNSPRKPWTKQRSGVMETSLTASAMPTKRRFSFGRRVPPSTRTSRKRSSPTLRSPNAQPKQGDSAERSSLRLSMPSAHLSVSLIPEGMKVCTTSCNASMPMPVFALPTTSGETLPAAAARRSATSIVDRGTSPSNSIYASIISSSTLASDSTNCSRSCIDHARSSGVAAVVPCRFF